MFMMMLMKSSGYAFCPWEISVKAEDFGFEKKVAVVIARRTTTELMIFDFLLPTIKKVYQKIKLCSINALDLVENGNHT